MSDEEIIKRRLLIDGDGTGEDRRLNVLLKQFLKWANSKNDSPETNQMMYDRLMAQLAQCQFTALKNERTLAMLNEELQSFTKVTSTIEESIELAKAEIEASKKELVIAKEIRKNKIEYDMLAKLIEEQPDRQETLDKIETVKAEIDQLIQKKLKLEHKFQKRRNDFTLLMYTLRELEKNIDEESSSESSDTESDSKSSTTEDDDGVMEVSDEDDVNGEGHSKFNRSRDESDEHKGRLKKFPSISEDSKEPMSVEEDAVLELSIDKDEHDVEAVGTT